LSWTTAKKTIQAGLDAAGNSGWTVLVANGTYTGTGNKNLDFNGKAIHLNSVGGAANCIIDCENSGKGFFFLCGETNDAIVQGFTIQNASDGGVYCSSSPTFTNCTIANNATDTAGGGVYCRDSCSPTFTDCTISGNSAYSYGGGVFCGGYGEESSSPTFTNCTISGNTASTEGKQIYTDSSVTLSYSCYANGANDVAGSGQVNPDHCINLDPLFVDAAGGDYHLQAGSPCIDAGSNSLLPEGMATDLDGNPRIVDGDGDVTATVDMGAYEFQP
jgi:hypothetical protein